MKRLAILGLAAAAGIGVSIWLLISRPGAGSNSAANTAAGPGRDRPAHAGPAEPSSSSPDNQAAAGRPPSRPLPLPTLPALAPAHPAIGQFRSWALRFLQAEPADVAEGVRLAREHRAALKSLIVSDPRTALEQAVPMVIRQRLPPEIVAELETRVSGQGPFEVLAVSPDSAPTEPTYRRFVTLDGTEYRARVYGRRAAQKTTPGFRVNGVAVDRELAVHEEPARLLETGERPDPSKQAVQTCPVSGLSTPVETAADGSLPPVTPETPAVEVGKQIIYLCDGGHFRQLVEDLLDQERTAAEGATGGPVPTTGSFPITRTSSTGVRKLLYMRVVFPDRRSESQTEAAAIANCKTLTDYFLEGSYGQCSFQCTVTPLLLLPRTETWYINDYNATGSNSPILNDAKEAARAAGFPPEDYQHYTVIYAGGPGSFGGLGSVGGGSAWLRTTSVGTFEHEVGHNVGVWHSNFWSTGGASAIGPGANSEYGHVKDVMGSSGSGGHFNASMKEQLQWIRGENYHTALQSGTYRIFQFDQPSLDPSRRFALKVAKDADRDYWLEFRQKLSTIPWWMNGASINWSPWGNASGNTTANGSNNGTQLIDTTPGSPDDREDSPLVIGRTFSDPEAGVHVTPVAKGGTTPESLDVVVNVGPFPGNQPPTLAISADATTIAAGGTVNFSASAADPDGDALAYFWEFGDKLGSYSSGSFSTDNQPAQNKTYATAGHYAARCTVSDMRGGSTTRTLLITVGTPATYTLSGTVTVGGVPLRDVRVSNGASGGSMRWGYTDSDGFYTIANLSAGSVTLSALKAGYTFTPAGFSNPVTVGPSQTGKDFSAAAGTFVDISAPDPVANESGDTATFRLTRTGDTSSALVVYTDFSGTATFSSDYTRTPAADTTTASPLELFTIPAGSSTLDITIAPAAVNDSAQEGPETIVLSLVNGGGASSYVPTGPQTATITLDDDDTTKARVSIVATAPETTEGGAAPGQFTVSRTGSTAAALTVNFSVSTAAGTATNGTDYTSIGTSVSIPVGASQTAIPITPLNDTAAEGLELVSLTLASSANYIVGTPSTATLYLRDDDIPVLTLAATDASANENGDTGRFTLTRSGDTTAELTVHYGISGSATHGVDYRALPGMILFAAGSATATVDVVPINDTHGEPAQTVILQLRSSAAYQVAGSGNATVTLNDDSDPPVVYAAATSAQVTEGGSGTFQLTTTGTGTGNITVRYTLSGTATGGQDFTVPAGTMSMARNTTANIALATLNDSLPEDAETVSLTLTPDPAYTVDLQNTATLLIRDNDVAHMVSVSSTSTAASETAAGKFYFSRTGSTTSAVTVHYSVGGTASPGADYTALPGTVDIPAGASGAYIDVTPVNDSAAEGAETVVVTLLPDPQPTPVYGIEIGSAAVTIADNDGGFTASLGFAQSSAIAPENSGAITLDVVRSGDTSGPATVEYGVQAGTALGNGVDYSAPPGVLSFAAGETTKSIPLALSDDSVSEDVETVTLALRNAAGASLAGSAAQHTVLILDNEPRVTIEATDPFAYESGDTAQFTVRRHGSTAGPLVVPLSVAGTATGGTDYSALPSSVTIPAGAASATLTLTPLPNAAAESVETVVVSLAASSTSLPGSQSSATASIGDAQADNPPFVRIASPRTATPAIPGGVGLAIDADAADDGPFTTAWSQISGPGAAAFSAAGQPDTDVTFPAAGTYVLRITADDGSQTSAADLTVTVGAPSLPWTGADIGSVGLPGSATEQHGLHAVNGAGTSLTGAGDSFFLRSRRLNGDGEIRARVRYVPNTSGSARVGVMLRESTATGSRSAAMLLSPAFNNADYFNYRATTGGTASSISTTSITPAWWVRVVRSGNSFSAYDSADGVTWTQRGTSQTLAMNSDILAGIAVMSATSSKLNTALVDNVRILGSPDNTGPAVSAGSDGNAGSGAAFALDGTLSDDALPSLPGATTLQWTQRSGPAAADIAAPTSPDTTAIFPSAGSYILRLTADDGELRTFDETVVTVTAPTVTVAATDPSAAETGPASGQFTLTRTGDTTAPLTVFFSKNGTATEGADYETLGSQAVIPAGAASIAVTVAPLADALAEGAEDVTLTLAPDPAYLVGSPAAAVVAIADLPVDHWRFLHFGANANDPAIAGDGADPNHNGLSNLAEYALALVPTDTGGGGLPVFQREAGAVSLTFTRRIDAPDITLSVEWCGDLQPLSWSSAGVTEEVTPIDGIRESVKASVATDGSVPQRFLRLKVTRP